MSCGCNDIHTCHAELIHAYADIQQVDIPFTAQDWHGLNYLKVMPCEITGPNEIGPHTLAPKSYSVTIYQNVLSGDVKLVHCTVLVNRTTGVITFWKSSRVPAFSGIVEVR